MSGPSPIDEAVALIRSRWSEKPDWGVVLGSGLGPLAAEVEAAAEVPYAELPHFPRSTAVGHAGRLLCGRLAGRPVVVMQGRGHLYEGCPPAQAALPIRVMRALGAHSLAVTNAAGGLRPEMRVGDPMIIDDHINLMFRNPLLGPNEEGIGPRFPDMSRPYDRDYALRALAAARRADVTCWRGVYVGMLGPTYETRAEYRMLRRIGGDAVGMSTVPEVIAAVHSGMRVLGVSAITNVCSPDRLATTSGQQVVDAAGAAADKLLAILRSVISA